MTDAQFIAEVKASSPLPEIVKCLISMLLERDAEIAQLKGTRDGLEHLYSGVVGEINIALKKIEMASEAFRTLRDGFDCDKDAHRYNNIGACRCCLADIALTELDRLEQGAE